MNSIGGLNAQPLTTQQLSLKAGQQMNAADQASFKDLLIDSIQQVNSMQQDANLAVENLMTGGEANPAEVLTAVQKADLAFRMTMQIRNKLMQAYDEVKNIRV